MKKKKITIFTLACIMGITCVACNTPSGELEEKKNTSPVEIGVYNMYDLDTYMRPIWNDRVIHNETVMFVGQKDEISLLYEADEILSVRSYDL